MNIIELSSMAPDQHFAQQRQHGGVRKMEHDCADQKYDQRTLLQRRGCPNRFAVASILLCTTRSLVIDFVGADLAQGEEGWKHANRDEKENAAIGDEVPEQAH
jgi:hypothetical protein